MAMEYFCAYHSYLKAVQNLSDAECGRLFKACLEYSMTGAEPEPTGNERFAFEFIKGDIDRAKAAYQKKCDGNRKNIQRRWEEADSKKAKSDTVVYDGIRSYTVEYDRNQRKGKREGEGKSKGEGKRDVERESPCGDVSPSVSPKTTKKSRPNAVQWAENVAMTNEEHEKLLNAHGAADTARLIEILDNYKGATGKKYKSDYSAILSWCEKRLEEEKAKNVNGYGGKSAQKNSNTMDDLRQLYDMFTGEDGP